MLLEVVPRVVPISIVVIVCHMQRGKEQDTIIVTTSDLLVLLAFELAHFVNLKVLLQPLLEDDDSTILIEPLSDHPQTGGK